MPASGRVRRSGMCDSFLIIFLAGSSSQVEIPLYIFQHEDTFQKEVQLYQQIQASDCQVGEYISGR